MNGCTIKDYYAVLGVPRNATAVDLKAAYRRAAQQHHPDRNNAADAADRFKEIKKAYDFLSDVPTRQAIDVLLNVASQRASHLPTPEEVDTKNIRDRVLTTRGWVLPDL